MRTKIVNCDCIHAYQDAKYGKGKRVVNEIKFMGGNIHHYRCTVCTKSHAINNAIPAVAFNARK